MTCCLWLQRNDGAECTNQSAGGGEGGSDQMPPVRVGVSFFVQEKWHFIPLEPVLTVWTRRSTIVIVDSEMECCIMRASRNSMYLSTDVGTAAVFITWCTTVAFFIDVGTQGE